MTAKDRNPILCCLIALIVGILIGALPVLAAPSATFKIEQVVWGTSTTNTVTVAPGDTDAPLTLNVRNKSSYPLNGIYATLYLNSNAGGIYVFTNTTGGLEASAVGQALQVGDIMYQTGEVQPGTAFALTFRLNIDLGAKPGNYVYAVRIEYLVNQSGVISDGVPQTLDVTVNVPNRAPIIGTATPMSANPTVYVGDFLNFSATCRDPDGDNLTYRWTLDDQVVANTTGFIYTPSDSAVGSHTVVLRTSDGTLYASQTWNVVVDKIRKTDLAISSNYLTAGLANQLNITLGNNLWKGTVDISMTLPAQAPLVFQGDSAWTFRQVEPNASVSLEPSVYAPSSVVGSTFTATLSVTYSDEYGRSYTDTHSIGLIVRGLIDIVVYDIGSTPQPTYSGSTVSIIATLLNKGNIAATNLNASLQSSPVLVLSSLSRYYMDQAEKNSPEPFSLKATVKADTAEGMYPVTFSVTYMDDQYVEHTLMFEAYVTVAQRSDNGGSQNGESPFLLFLQNGGWTLLVLIAVAVVLSVLYVRRVLRTEPQTVKKVEG